MAALGVNTLQTTRCSGQCLITLKDTSKAGDKAIRMTDGRCYYIYAISGYIKSLIRRGMDIGHPNFVLPTRVPITNRDLTMLFINPDEIRARAMAERVRVPVAPDPRPFDPNRLYIPDNHFDNVYIPDARAQRKPSKRKRAKRTKRARKMTSRK